VWLAYTAAAVADPDLADLHLAHNQALLARINRLLADARPHLADDARADAAVALIALIEGLNTLAALDPATYHSDRQLKAIDDALARLAGPAPHRGAQQPIGQR
jgi:hypothetical protein